MRLNNVQREIIKTCLNRIEARRGNRFTRAQRDRLRQLAATPLGSRLLANLTEMSADGQDRSIEAVVHFAMNTLNPRKKKRRQQFIKFSLSPLNLARIIDGELPGAMWEYYLAYCDHIRKQRKKHPTAKERRKFDLSLPLGLRLVHSFIRFDGDILNGGFCQYIGNHSQHGDPEQVYEDLEALRTVGAGKSAKLLENVIAIYQRDYDWPSRKARRYDVGPCEHPELERLSGLRCNEKSSRRDYAILDAYLREHLDECLLPVEVKCSRGSLEPFLKSSKTVTGE